MAADKLAIEQLIEAGMGIQEVNKVIVHNGSTSLLTSGQLVGCHWTVA